MDPQDVSAEEEGNNSRGSYNGSWTWAQERQDDDWNRALVDGWNRSSAQDRQEAEEDNGSRRSTDQRLMPRNAPKSLGYSGDMKDHAFRIYKRKAEI